LRLDWLDDDDDDDEKKRPVTTPVRGVNADGEEVNADVDEARRAKMEVVNSFMTVVFLSLLYLPFGNNTCVLYENSIIMQYCGKDSDESLLDLV